MKYRCVPQIASPEARKSESTTALYKVSLCTSNRSAGGAKKRKYYSAIQRIVAYLKSPRWRREQAKVLQCYTKYCCVPQTASPEARKSESTTALYTVSLCTSNRFAGNARKQLVRQHTTALYKVSFNIRNILQHNTNRMVLREALGGVQSRARFTTSS